MLDDLGNGALFTDEHAPSVTLPIVVGCVVEAIEELYSMGARKFIVQNLVPLELSPQYSVSPLNRPGAVVPLAFSILT